MKISVVMQVYLGDYPGSRTASREKFVRAIHSFLAQTHPDKELIIVSDGCAFAKRIYELVYTSNPLIKFVWLDRASPRMYEKLNGRRHFRGYPKRIGVEHATGDIICYLDSDDIILPNYLFSLNAYWSDFPETIEWVTNTLRIMNLKMLQLETKDHKGVLSTQSVDLSAYGVAEDFFVNICVPPNQISCATYNLSHRRHVKARWQDTVNEHEDVDFLKQLRENHQGTRISVAGYVVCHYKDSWDC